MDAATRRRRRLERLLRLALAYKDCSRKELARVLGRDPTKLVPGTGIPKLDLVVELAGVLDWPVGDVVSYLWHERHTNRDPRHEPYGVFFGQFAPYANRCVRRVGSCWY
jgi:hypothetical protein